MGSAQGLILLLAVLSIGHGNRRANRILATFIAVISLRLFIIALEYQTGSSVRYPDLIYAVLHTSYAIGPLLYLYVRLLVQPNWKATTWTAGHFLPIPIAALALIPGGPILDVDVTTFIDFNSLPDHIQTRVVIASTPVFISLGIYSLISLRLLRNYQWSIREQFSALESINLNWLKVLVWSCLIIAMISFSSELYRAFHGNSAAPRAFYSVIFSVILIYYIGLRGLRQPLIFEQVDNPISTPTADESADDTTTQDEKYQKSGLSKEHVEVLWQRLCHQLDTEAPYLQQGIKLADLASQIGTRPNYLSQTINSRSQESFFDFINRHRVAYAQKLLLERPDLSVSEVALASGFSSQNVFNGHFKKHFGLTPTQHRKNNANKIK